MFKTKTVFVLGAGASIPFYYPSGVELKGELANLINDPEFDKCLSNAFPDIKAMDNFRLLIGSLMESPAASIDQFLEHRAEYLSLGKFAIAYFFNKKHEAHLKSNYSYNSNWYLTLFQKLLYSNKLKVLVNNTVSFVTFNYDVSLEMFFHKSLGSLFKDQLGETGAKDFFKKIPIQHVYGKIRNWSWENEKGPGMAETELSFYNIKNISEKYFYLIHEDESFGEGTIRAREIIEDSNRVIFLGFGFHPENMTKLNIYWKTEEKIFEATSVGLTGAEQAVINNQCEQKIKFYGWDCNDYLLNRMDFLTS